MDDPAQLRSEEDSGPSSLLPSAVAGGSQTSVAMETRGQERPPITDDHEQIAETYTILEVAGGNTEALARLRGMAEARPDNPELRNNYANALLIAGRHIEALEELQTALRLRPRFPEALNNLGATLVALGRYQEAVEICSKALRLHPYLGSIHNNLGNAQKALRDFAEAEASYRRAVASDPTAVASVFNLGTLLLSLDRAEEALPCLEAAYRGRPDNVEILNGLGVALKCMHRYGESEAILTRALNLMPNNANTHNNLGTLFYNMGNLDGARASYEKAVTLAPEDSRAWCNLGQTRAALGDIAAGRAALRQAITLDPEMACYHRYLSDLTSLSNEEVETDALHSLAAKIETLPEKARMECHFALGKAADDVGCSEKAIRHYFAGNALKRAMTPYDEAATLDELAAIPSRFPASLIRGGGGDPTSLPMFIVGMPRSGTTLVEQILASISGVYGGDEMDTFDSTLAAFPDPHLLDNAGWQKLAADYLSRIRPLAPTASRIINKVPLNFRHLGVIHRAFPEAKIVHVTRDPVDTCFSCFTKLFSGNLNFTYNIEELGRYYHAYEQVMNHWRRVLPNGTMIELNYEALVKNFEFEVRRLLAFCGLAWDPACLAFFETQRVVRTASMAQVREPLFETSIRRSAPYEALLAPLMELRKQIPLGN